MQLYDGMGTDVGSLMIECSLTICDVLNQDESTPCCSLLAISFSKDTSTLSAISVNIHKCA